MRLRQVQRQVGWKALPLVIFFVAASTTYIDPKTSWPIAIFWQCRCYRSLILGFILRSLMAEFIAEPPKAIEFVGEPDLRSKVRHLADGCVPA
ncbi:hypothetical protein CU048_14165 [Beijerinckiaceae bacterium]|nr:hypothetical protein CU048_14165 [Beijerinckiaceae bacterium]